MPTRETCIVAAFQRQGIMQTCKGKLVVGGLKIKYFIDRQQRRGKSKNQHTKSGENYDQINPPSKPHARTHADPWTHTTFTTLYHRRGSPSNTSTPASDRSQWTVVIRQQQLQNAHTHTHAEQRQASLYQQQVERNKNRPLSAPFPLFLASISPSEASSLSHGSKSFAIVMSYMASPTMTRSPGLCWIVVTSSIQPTDVSILRKEHAAATRVPQHCTSLESTKRNTADGWCGGVVTD